MLGLVLLYWIGKRFYKLAELYNRSMWGYAILGIVVYYGGIIVLSFLIGIVLAIISPETVDNMNETVFGILMIPVGVFISHLLYKYLEKKWKKISLSPIELVEEFGQEEE